MQSGLICAYVGQEYKYETALMDFLLNALLCFSIGIVVQSLVIWVATKIVCLVCTFRHALLISLICNFVLFIPFVGIFASAITFFVLLGKWMEAEPADAVLVALVTLGLQFLIVFSLR